jgi:hypothetical protein
MAKVDFFQYIVEIKDENFGIYDPQDETPAKVSTDIKVPDKGWDAKVINLTGDSVFFSAVDHQLNLRDAENHLEKSCDVLLCQFDRYLIFTEIKDKKSRWYGRAIEQLTNTIRLFRENHPDKHFVRKQAYICNRQHLRANESHQSRMQEFKDQTGFRLKTGTEIKITL